MPKPKRIIRMITYYPVRTGMLPTGSCSEEALLRHTKKLWVCWRPKEHRDMTNDRYSIQIGREIINDISSGELETLYGFIADFLCLYEQLGDFLNQTEKWDSGEMEQ